MYALCSNVGDEPMMVLGPEEARDVPRLVVQLQLRLSASHWEVIIIHQRGGVGIILV
jgi:hypothetical protein